MENLLYFTHFRVIEDVVLVVSKADRPIVPCIHRPFVNYRPHQPVLVLPEHFEFIVQDWVAVLYLFTIQVFETIQVDYEHRWVHLYFKLFESKGHVVAVLAVPSILFVELFGLVEEGEAIVYVGIAQAGQIFLAVVDSWSFPEKYFEADFLVSISKEPFEAGIEYLGEIAVGALFVAESTHVSVSFVVIYVNLNPNFLCK